jgi:hypothetical protein
MPGAQRTGASLSHFPAALKRGENEQRAFGAPPFTCGSFMPGAQRTGASLSCFALRLKPRKTGKALVLSKHPFNNLSALRAQILTEQNLNRKKS